MIRRPPRSTLDRSSAASDVYKRQIFFNARPPFVPFILPPCPLLPYTYTHKIRCQAQGFAEHGSRHKRSAHDGGKCDLCNRDQPEHLAKARRPEADAPHCADRCGATDQAGRFRGMARPARKRGGREYLRKTPVFDLATRYSDEIAETPFVQRAVSYTHLTLPTSDLV